ncbi:hypothetical protein MGG_03389 [Pyricularia oryzae 70-15]|uniref:J domain-containing protein n=1 Tax=Pyricularia oryzae (strain 70-15 / ATCC MYA-4617 / FGSC 8958) TaxID=242507 RepID=G4N8U2_PYRO7|nr:uncharacterized protein MGG_03389 [Pyricularia oryzae 70-15]EHA50236.1 hypothetical protein MGG_03389 [Pyricularia oryzae 70-15]
MFLKNGAPSFGSSKSLARSEFRSRIPFTLSLTQQKQFGPQCCPYNHRRSYNTTSADGEPKQDRCTPAMVWPNTARPTPYEIFNSKPGAPYSKGKFYELAKQYHPDRYTEQGDHLDENGLSRATKLERYKLVVAANDILSNPVKRREYDQFGLGWATGEVRDLNEELRAKDQAWRTAPNSPAMNSSWQDWEKWRHRRDGTAPKQEPLFMSNGGFAIVLCACVVVFIWAQASQASQRSSRVMQARDKMHQAATDNLYNTRMQRATLSQNSRVQLFLHKREFGDNPFEPVGQLPAESPKK